MPRSKYMDNVLYPGDWRRHVPPILGWVTFIAALWCVVSLMFRNHFFSFFHIGSIVFDFFNLPVSQSLFNAGLLLVFSAAVMHRKRVVVWVVLVLELVGLLFALAAITVIVDSKDFLLILIFLVFSALVSIIVSITIWKARDAFPGRIVAGHPIQAITVLVLGLLCELVLGIILVEAFPNTLTSKSARFRWTINSLFGADFSFFNDEIVGTGPHWVEVLLSICSGLLVLVALLVFFRAQKIPGRTREDDLAIRRMLAKYGKDSLGYFATRDDRSAVFSPDGKAAVSYGIAAGVSLAAGDPLGDPSAWQSAINQWLAACYRYGWTPGVISVSEKGARAYKEAGFIVKALGDEATVHPATFSLNGSSMKPLAQAVRRVRSAGVQIKCRRLVDISTQELITLRTAAEEFRIGKERGFSMSLDRILAPIDSQTMVVTAHDSKGTLHCLLTFVPWGKRGLSLNLMRRNPESVNGVIEAMVVELIEYVRDRAIVKISLNFAMLRQAFDEGTAVNASLIKRLLRRGMLVASRFWQLDSLYESNARYQPHWYTRYLCYPASPQFTSVLIACGELEGFLPNLGRNLPSPSWEIDDEYLNLVNSLEYEDSKALLEDRRISEQERVRLNKTQALRELGRDPFPASLSLGQKPREIAEQLTGLSPGERIESTVRVGGRIGAIRNHGGIIFIDLYRDGGNLQMVFSRDIFSKSQMQQLRLLDLGDVLVVTGTPIITLRGEASVLADSWDIAAKALRPIPRRISNLDTQTKTGSRVLNLVTDHAALELLVKRSKAVSQIRSTLIEAGYLEVQTPILQPIQGGANARPFVTHLNAYSAEVFLRIAPELYLKRLAIAGMEAVFEMGASFRNEGVDATHNPEFTSLEAYRAGGDYRTMRELTQLIIQDAARAIHGKCVCWRPQGTLDITEPVVAVVNGIPMIEVDISGDWPVYSVYEAVSKACGQNIDSSTTQEELRSLCDKHGIDYHHRDNSGVLIGELYDELVEANTVKPTFYTDFPLSTSPLTRAHPTDPALAERWDLVAFGMELGTAYTELTDPVDQRKRLTEQSLAASAGDPEAMSLDEDFLEALELGMTSTGGMGLGIDRTVMLLTGVNIRQIIAFPFVRPGTR